MKVANSKASLKGRIAGEFPFTQPTGVPFRTRVAGAESMNSGRGAPLLLVGPDAILGCSFVLHGPGNLILGPHSLPAGQGAGNPSLEMHSFG